MEEEGDREDSDEGQQAAQLVQKNREIIAELPKWLLEQLKCYDRAHNEESNDVYRGMEEGTLG